mgnify:CR=1 FL=1
MGNFSRDKKRPGGGFGRKFGGKSFGDKKRFGDRDGGRMPMHQAICDECGVSCEVPFKPTGDRPVYCSNCFGKQNGGAPRQSNFGGERRERGRFEDRPRFEEKQMHDAVCDVCGKACQIPFRPTAGKPVLCNSCFKKTPATGNNNKELLDQLALVNDKLDKLFAILTHKEVSVEKGEKEVKPKAKARKVEVKAKKVAKKKSK